MRKFLVGVAVAVAALSLTACTTPNSAPTQSAAPSIDPELIPTAPPEGVVDVDASKYADPFGEYVFKVGDGPTWCTISPAMDGATEPSFVTCEHNEASVRYEPIPIPSDCTASYGYQIRLWSAKPEGIGNSEQAQFTCTSGFYADPSSAPILENAQRISVGELTCYVVGVTARCENTSGKYIVLGPDAWALGI